MYSNKNSFINIWLIVPALSGQSQAVSDFIDHHQWFLRNGGRILVKSKGEIDSNVRNTIISHGVNFIEIEDDSLYDAWNQTMDYLSPILDGQHAYVIFLGLDDVLAKNFIFSAIPLVVQHNPPDFIYGNYRVRLGNRYKDGVSSSTPALFGKNDYWFDVCHPGMVNRWKVISSERFDTSYKLAGNFDFYIGLTQKYDVSYKYIPIELYRPFSAPI